MPLRHLEAVLEQLAAVEAHNRRRETPHVVDASTVTNAIALSRRLRGEEEQDKAATAARRFAAALRTAAEHLRTLPQTVRAAAPKGKAPEKPKGPAKDKKPRRLPFDMQALRAFADLTDAQVRAGKRVDAFTLALAVAARALIGFRDKLVALRPGRYVGPLRFAAHAMRHVARRRPALSAVRGALLAPSRVIHRIGRSLRRVSADRGPQSARIVAKAAGAGRKLVGAGRKLAGAGRKLAGAAAARTAGAAARTAGAAAAAGTAGAAAETAGTAAAAGTAGAAAGTAGAAAAGTAAAALSAAGPIGLVVGVAVALAALPFIAKQLGMAFLEARYRIAEFSATVGRARAEMQAYEIGSKVREGARTGESTLLLTREMIRLRRELGPIRRFAINIGNLSLTAMAYTGRLIVELSGIVDVLRLVNQALNHILRYLNKTDFTDPQTLRFLDELATRPRSIPPRRRNPPP
ncbi:hypothetical protein JCM19992_16190 [Thermostilla marina]